MTRPTDAVLVPVGFGGLEGYCTGWAGDKGGTVYASLIGRTTALNGIWAAFQDHEVLRLLERPALFKRARLEGAKYHTLRARLPETGWQHLVLLHSQATAANLPDVTFFVLAESPDPPLARFWAQWNNALPLPALPEWAAYLWRAGWRKGLVAPCPSEGIRCVRVRADSVAAAIWAEILQAGIEDGELSIPRHHQQSQEVSP